MRNETDKNVQTLHWIVLINEQHVLPTILHSLSLHSTNFRFRKVWRVTSKAYNDLIRKEQENLQT